MLKPVYIISSSAISPQHTFGEVDFLRPIVTTDSNRLDALPQDYSKYISPVAIRRMSRLLKMAISTGMKSLSDAGIDTINGIITGTGRGSVVDMEHFLKDMIGLEEDTLNPTYFIQSTYNSVNGWLAVQTKCMGYNQTYVHRGHSFELALLDAQMWLGEAKENQYYLVGSYDETTDEYYAVRQKAGYWKKQAIDSRNLLQEEDTNGTIAGEGAAFFTVSNSKENSICALLDIKLLQDANAEEVQKQTDSLLQRNGITINDLSVIISGQNGDALYAPFYNTLLEKMTTATICGFKHLCGEYDTASGFALWLACNLFATGSAPAEIIMQKGSSTTMEYILIVNHFVFNSATIMLLKSN